MGRGVRVAGAAGLAAVLAAAAYPLPWRRWCLTWGASQEEVERAIPGDELMPKPDLLSTRGPAPTA